MMFWAYQEYMEAEICMVCCRGGNLRSAGCQP